MLQAGPGGAAILAGSRCAVCRQTIFSLWLGTGARCGVCSFLVCRHCASQVTCLMHNPCVPRFLVTGAPVNSVMHRICGYDGCIARQHSSCGGTQHCSTAGDRDGWCSVRVCWGLQLGPSRTLIVLLCTAPAACSVPAAHCYAPQTFLEIQTKFIIQWQCVEH